MNEFFYHNAPAIMVLGIGCSLLVAIAAFPFRSKITYSRRLYLLTKSEQLFYRSLCAACRNEYVVFSKVRIADVLTPPRMKSKKKWWRLHTQISSKHIDFTLCRPHDLAIVCCIELDDKSHRRAERRKRDAFVNKAFDVAELPLFRVEAQSQYELDKLIALVRSRV